MKFAISIGARRGEHRRARTRTGSWRSFQLLCCGCPRARQTGVCPDATANGSENFSALTREGTVAAVPRGSVTPGRRDLARVCSRAGYQANWMRHRFGRTAERRERERKGELYRSRTSEGNISSRRPRRAPSPSREPPLVSGLKRAISPSAISRPR